MQRSSAELLLQHRQLLWSVTRTELRARYAGSLIGKLWVGLAPLLILCVYAVIYTMIFNFRPADLSRLGYVMHLFAGIVPFLMMSEALTNGVMSIVSNKAVLNNTVFPIDLAPPKAVLMSQGTMVVGFYLILIIELFAAVAPWTYILLPIIWGLSFITLCGLCWILSLLNVVFRDMKDLISVIMMMLFIASPIAYTPAMVPDTLKFLLIVNPFSYYVSTFQDLAVHGRIPGIGTCIFLLVFSFGVFALGSWMFSRSKRVLIDYV